VAFENSPFYFKLNRDKVNLNIHQSNFFVRIFSGTIFTPGAGAAKGLNLFSISLRPWFVPHKTKRDLISITNDQSLLA